MHQISITELTLSQLVRPPETKWTQCRWTRIPPWASRSTSIQARLRMNPFEAVMVALPLSCMPTIDSRRRIGPSLTWNLLIENRAADALSRQPDTSELASFSAPAFPISSDMWGTNAEDHTMEELESEFKDRFTNFKP